MYTYNPYWGILNDDNCRLSLKFKDLTTKEWQIDLLMTVF